jgi:hypothetical protein
LKIIVYKAHVFEVDENDDDVYIRLVFNGYESKSDSQNGEELEWNERLNLCFYIFLYEY